MSINVLNRGGPLGGKGVNLESITYSSLVTLKSGSGLKPGQYYRITDYVTKINGTYDLTAFLGMTAYLPYAESEEHPFDVIVLALSANELSEDAYAMLHGEGQNSGGGGEVLLQSVGGGLRGGNVDYFANNNLSAWRLKYCLENDTTRFSWADSAYGKGVIFYMKDEFNNECWYDFKNIKFVTYALRIIGTSTTGVTQMLGYDSGHGQRYGNFYKIYQALINYMTTGSYSSPYVRDYDFAVESTILGVIQFSEINSTFKTYFNADTYFTFDYFDVDNSTHIDMSLTGMANNNSIGPSQDALSGMISGAPRIEYGLSFNTFQFDSKDSNSTLKCEFNKISEQSYGNIFGHGAHRNTAETTFQFNVFGSLCFNNLFGTSFILNVFERDIQSNFFGAEIMENVFGFGTGYNNFANTIQKNLFYDNVENCILGPNLYNCDFKRPTGGLYYVHIHGNLVNTTINNLPAANNSGEGMRDYFGADSTNICTKLSLQTASYKGNVAATNLTANRNYELPNANGTLATEEWVNQKFAFEIASNAWTSETNGPFTVKATATISNLTLRDNSGVEALFSDVVNSAGVVLASATQNGSDLSLLFYADEAKSSNISGVLKYVY